jgi:maleylpyruvate isomerase
VSPTEVSARLAALRASTAAMVAGFEERQWTDADIAAPIRLPDWTRGHVLTHIARNADSIAQALGGALRGEIVRRYPDGPEGRAADIEAGAGRPALAQLADVRDSADRLDRVFGAVADAEAWDATADTQPCRAWIRARWQEVEIHRLDADPAYSPDQWPSDFVALLLPRLAGRLAERTSAPIRVEVVVEGSLGPDLVGRTWTTSGAESTGDRNRTDVRGPDWALLAWLAGRPWSVGDALSAVPELTPWS